MKIDILTLFPEMFSALQTSILKRGQEAGALEINVLNIRDFSLDKHKKCDDYPFGGGAGLVMMAQPIADAIKSIKGFSDAKKIYMSPRGSVLNQQKVKSLSTVSHLIILCGHYEGVDQRVIDKYIDEEISIGDFVLTGGEIPCMALVDSVSRYIDGVLGNMDSTLDESFSSNMLEYSQYTHPREFEGASVPDVLISGNHQKIQEWRQKNALEITSLRRPDLLKTNHSTKNKKGIKNE